MKKVCMWLTMGALLFISCTVAWAAGPSPSLSIRLENAFKEIRQSSDELLAPGRMVGAALKAAF